MIQMKPAKPIREVEETQEKRTLRDANKRIHS